jgi:hypothetical protein
MSISVATVKRYRCSFCFRGWSSRSRAEKHAEGCVKDPSVRACATCRYDYRGGDGINEPAGACCDLGIRPKEEICLRHCHAWEARVI